MKRSSAEPATYEEAAKVCLIERNTYPSRLPLVNPIKVGKTGANNLEDLFMEFQQVQYLQQQTHQIFQVPEKNPELSKVACNFHKVPGNIYHLYERPNGQKYFSMLSPEEWIAPHPYCGSFRLEADQSWSNLSMNSLTLFDHPHSRGIPMDV